MTKSELGMEAQALVNAGRIALRPTFADRERIFSALSERVSGDYGSGHSAAPPPPPAPAPLARGLGLGLKAFYATAGALAVGGVLASLALTRPESHAAQPSTPPAKSLPPAAPPPSVVAPATVESSTPAATLEIRSAAAKRSADSLAEEVSILSRAETELHAGRAGSALALLQEHQRKFPRGALVEERIAARIQALCALGRLSEAQTALARLKRLSPESPHETRAREACAANARH
jgi:hypothetical protein